MQVGKVLKFWMIIGLLIGVILSVAISGSSSTQSTGSNYGINAFKSQYLDNANFVIGSQNDKDTVNTVFEKTPSYSKSEINPNVLIGGPVANKLVGDINAELGVDFEVWDSAVTGESPTRIILKSNGNSYEVTSDDFCKKGYVAILYDGKDVAVEGTDRCATRAGSRVLIGKDLPYDKIIALAEDLDNDGEIDLDNEVRIVEAYKSPKPPLYYEYKGVLTHPALEGKDAFKIYKVRDKYLFEEAVSSDHKRAGELIDPNDGIPDFLILNAHKDPSDDLTFFQIVVDKDAIDIIPLINVRTIDYLAIGPLVNSPEYTASNKRAIYQGTIRKVKRTAKTENIEDNAVFNIPLSPTGVESQNIIPLDHEKNFFQLFNGYVVLPATKISSTGEPTDIEYPIKLFTIIDDETISRYQTWWRPVESKHDEVIVK